MTSPPLGGNVGKRMRVWINNSETVYNIRGLYPSLCLKFLQISRSLGKPFASTEECFGPPTRCVWEFTRAPCMLFGIPARSSRLGGVCIASQTLCSHESRLDKGRSSHPASSDLPDLRSRTL